ncbi:unnamed protein product [Effrenium voratum]|nr:unnamed protein product [Effrenium voratum]
MSTMPAPTRDFPSANEEALRQPETMVRQCSGMSESAADIMTVSTRSRMLGNMQMRRMDNFGPQFLQHMPGLMPMAFMSGMAANQQQMQMQQPQMQQSQMQQPQMQQPQMQQQQMQQQQMQQQPQQQMPQPQMQQAQMQQPQMQQQQMQQAQMQQAQMQQPQMQQQQLQQQQMQQPQMQQQAGIGGAYPAMAIVVPVPVPVMVVAQPAGEGGAPNAGTAPMVSYCGAQAMEPNVKKDNMMRW